MDWQQIVYAIEWPQHRLERAYTVIGKRFNCDIWRTLDNRLIPFTLMRKTHLRNALNHQMRKFTMLDYNLDRNLWILTVWHIGRLHREVWRRGYTIHPDKYKRVWEDYYRNEHIPANQECKMCNQPSSYYVVSNDKSSWRNVGWGDEYVRDTILYCPCCHAENKYQLLRVGSIDMHYWNGNLILDKHILKTITPRREE